MSRFDAHLREPLRRREVTWLQVNVGKRCNQACRHCHVEAGPKRTEAMSRAVAERVVDLARATPTLECVDLTGGAPELNPSFRWLVAQFRGLRVIDRCNLTVVFEPGQEDLPEFLAEHDVEIVASLPCYGPDNVDAQRGRGVFEKSIAALRRLNALGYGTSRSLSLVYNPLGPSLPPGQRGLEAAYRKRLGEDFGVVFTSLLTLANMPIGRFSASPAYVDALEAAFNPATVDGLMCRSLVSVGWDGRLYDCDFNQMLDMRLGPTVFDVDDLSGFAGAQVRTGDHCFGCTAGAGSSCGGAIRASP